MTTPKRAYARYTSESLALLGKFIQHGRRRRGMSEKELAERLGVARSTVQRIEGGEPNVGIGMAFEAAALVGVKLFNSDESGITALSGRMDDRIAVLPKRAHKAGGKVVDDF